MATIRRVAAVNPIKDADRIELITVDGWDVIDKKGVWQVGELVVYLEPDTMCPTDDEHFAFLADRGTKKMVIDGKEIEGHKLRTIKLRGVYSQGLILKPSLFGITDEEALAYCESREALDERIGVWEYRTPIKAGRSPKYIINPYDRSVAPVTDAERIQNCTDLWEDLKKVDCYATIKVDGTSMTMVFDSRKDKLRLFSHHREIDYDEPSIAQQSYHAALTQGIVQFCIENPDITVQYELTGPSIQRKVTSDYVCHVFAVWDRKEMRKYSYDEIWKKATHEDTWWRALLHSHVPLVGEFKPTMFDKVSDVLEMADNIEGHVAKGKLDEGIVVHITGQGTLDDKSWAYLKNRLGPNMEYKAVSRRYLAKER
jgi:RNA ligase (TIGR02306 family)